MNPNDISVESGSSFSECFRFKPTPQSPVQWLLECNTPPSASESLALRKEVDLITADMKQLDEHVALLQKYREELLLCREKRKGALSPLRRLPPEIISHIFTLCDHDRLSHVPLVLSHVSRQWRDVALDTSSVWTKIDLCLSPNISIESQTDMVRHWMTYSRQCHLSVKLSTSWDHVPDNYRHPAMDLLLSQVHRWEKVSLAFKPDYLQQFGIVKCHFPHLKTLIFSWIETGMSALFKDSPSLRSVDVGYISHWSWRLCRLPWPSLSQLKANGARTHLFDLLRECASLTNCELSLTDELTTRQPSTPLVHYNLISLRLYSDHSYPCDRLLKSVSFPNLCEFEIKDSERPDRDEWGPIAPVLDHLAPFLSRSSRTLRRISLSTDWAYVDLDACLEVVPGVKDVRLGSAVVKSLTTALLSRLTWQNPSADIILPELENLEITTGSTVQHILQSDFAAMLLSRWHFDASETKTGAIDSPQPTRPYPRLRRVVITSGMSLESLREGSSGDCLRSCRDGGLDVSVAPVSVDTHILGLDITTTYEATRISIT